ATVPMPKILMRSEVWNDGATTERAIRNPTMPMLVEMSRPTRRATPWWVFRLRTVRRTKDLAMAASSMNAPKTTSARIRFGRSAMVSLMILTAVFQAFEKSTGIDAPRTGVALTDSFWCEGTWTQIGCTGKFSWVPGESEEGSFASQTSLRMTVLAGYIPW